MAEYVITTAAQLAAFSGYPMDGTIPASLNDAGTYDGFALGANINLGTSSFQGFGEAKANLYFDGKGYAIQNWSIGNGTSDRVSTLLGVNTNENVYCFGLFPFVNNKSIVIRNVRFDNYSLFVSSNSPNSSVACGVIAGWLKAGSLTVNNVVFNGCSMDIEYTKAVKDIIGSHAGMIAGSVTRGASVATYRIQRTKSISCSQKIYPLTVAGAGNVNVVAPYIGSCDWRGITPVVKENLLIDNSVDISCGAGGVTANTYAGDMIATTAAPAGSDISDNIYCNSGDDANAVNNNSQGTLYTSAITKVNKSTTDMLSTATYITAGFAILGDITNGYDFQWTTYSSDDYIEPIRRIDSGIIVYVSTDGLTIGIRDPEDSLGIGSLVEDDTLTLSTATGIESYTVVSVTPVYNGFEVVVAEATTVDPGPPSGGGDTEEEEPPVVVTLTDKTVTGIDASGRLLIVNTASEITTTVGEWIVIDGQYVYEILSIEAVSGVGFWLTTDGYIGDVSIGDAVTNGTADAGKVQVIVPRGYFSTGNVVSVIDNNIGQLQYLITQYRYIEVASYSEFYDILSFYKIVSIPSTIEYLTASHSQYEIFSVLTTSSSLPTYLSGLDHLNGNIAKVALLRDTDRLGVITVQEISTPVVMNDSGIIRIDDAFTEDIDWSTDTFIVGTEYESLVITVPVDTPDRYNVFTDAVKRSFEVFVRYYLTQGGKISINDEDYVDLKAVYSYNKQGVKIKLNTKYEYDKKIAVKQDEPYPMTILNLIPNMP